MKTRKTAGIACAAVLATAISALPISAQAAPSSVSSFVASGDRFVGQEGNVWGTAIGAPHARVFTQVWLDDHWSTSQVRTTDDNGYYVIPVTYGLNSAGTTSWRVGVEAPDGLVYSENFTVTRIGPITADAADQRPTGAEANTWGSVELAPNTRVFTQVRIGQRWSTSQTGSTDSEGGYVLPLTYGQDHAGTYTFRVGTVTEAGTHFAKSFEITRSAEITAQAAADRPVGATANAWGSVDAPGARVFTQVKIGDRWSTSQVRTADADGSFVIPLTYGMNNAGTYTWRVGATTATGTVYSNTFTQERTGGGAVAAMNFALSKVGSAYQARGTGPNAFDCSGLTYWAYQQVGITLPRTSGAQAGVGRPVSREDLQPGDLVFFYHPISHVGIYIGDGKVVHAANPRSGVSTLPMEYMPFAGARRVVG